MRIDKLVKEEVERFAGAEADTVERLKKEGTYDERKFCVDRAADYFNRSNSAYKTFNEHNKLAFHNKIRGNNKVFVNLCDEGVESYILGRACEILSSTYKQHVRDM